ncbi:cytochrome family 51 (sterol 14-demethylase) [Fusarium pseudocircinatum]|uniref:Cytochrome family 51 (Sterol 14-demethylase) n=1 Tax=Fusarium pseudocircinatum TaxID=56676 RepID=A0A8H5P3Y6_9HYPO|nr:cytochrome family 51 (sterol 14-demethylase) [Fusarium pseudocircinatum]
MSYYTVINRAVEANWTKETSPAQVTIKQLSDVLGIDVSCDPDWTKIVSRLNNFFVDKTQLVLTVAQFITIWAHNAAVVATDRGHRDWVDTCMEKVLENNSELVLEVKVGEGAQPYTRWEDDRFVLYLPKMKPHPPQGYSAAIKEGIIEVFERSA